MRSAIFEERNTGCLVIVCVNILLTEDRDRNCCCIFCFLFSFLKLLLVQVLDVIFPHPHLLPTVGQEDEVLQDVLQSHVDLETDCLSGRKTTVGSSRSL